MRVLGLLSALCLVAIAAGHGLGQADRAQPEAGATTSPARLAPGDLAPALRPIEWLQKGAFDGVHAVDGRLITVIEFVASWDPLSRAVLPAHDELQAKLAARGVRFVAISEERPKEVRAYLRQAKLPHLAVACDLGGAVLARYRGGLGSTSLPYAVVQESEHRARIVWVGPVLLSETGTEPPLARFERVVTQAAAGTLDVGAARAAELRRRDLHDLKQQLLRAASEGGLEAVKSVVKAARQGRQVAGAGDVFIDALAGAAWELSQEEPPNPARAAIAVELAETAVEEANGDFGRLFDIAARAQFAAGDADTAATYESLSLAFPEEGGSSRADREAALARYQRPPVELGRSPEASAEGMTPSPPETLTAEEATADFTALDDFLRLNYVASDDRAWRLAGRGSSWKRSRASFLRRIEGQAEWRGSDFAGLIADYLRDYQDHHLSLVRRWADGEVRPLAGVSPYFADVRVREVKGRYVITEASGEAALLAGAEILRLPVIGSPDALRAEQTYLFPTLPREAGQKEFLLGRLTDGQPSEVVIGIPGGRKMHVPLHRGRSAFRVTDWAAYSQAPPWSLIPGAVPVLAVRAMGGSGLAGMVDTAGTLRAKPAVILDLRHNGGGADMFARAWASRFTNQPLPMYRGRADFRRGQRDPLRRWDSSLGSATVTDTSLAPGPYQGRLAVLIDNGVASSGEGFADIAAQIHGAVLFGENTGGYGTYGDVSDHFTLPHSRIVLSYGHTKYVPAGRPFREGVGLFPDYWLDTDDPVRAVAEYILAR